MTEGVDYFVHCLPFPNMANDAIAFSNDDGTVDIYLNTLFEQECLKSRLSFMVRQIENKRFCAKQAQAK